MFNKCTCNEDSKLKKSFIKSITQSTMRTSVKPSTIPHDHLKLLFELSSAQGHSEDPCEK